MIKMNLVYNKHIHLFVTFLTIKSGISISPQYSKTGSSCEWIGSSSGQEPTCLPNWYVNGICQSKRRPNCKESKLSLKKYTQMMQCCQMKYNNDQDEVCQSVSDDVGTSRSSLEICPNDETNSEGLQILAGVCSSDKRKSCSGSDGNQSWQHKKPNHPHNGD